jgi:hypothetical protein
MKRREFLKLAGTIAGTAMTIYLPAGWTPAKAAAKWKVGFSQCTTLEGIVTLPCGEREASAAQELSGCCDCGPPCGHRRSAKRAVRLG